MSLVLESKVVPESRIDDAVKRILRVKFAAGIFDLPTSAQPPLDVVGCKVTLTTACLSFLGEILPVSESEKLCKISI